jgi:DNA replication protein DnaC
MQACTCGYSVKFCNAASLATDLVEASEYKRLSKLEKQLSKVDLLILDELPYLSFNRHQSDLLFKIISDRSEKGSIIITTNLEFSKWTELFDNPTIVAALVNRITFRSHVLNMNGNSYRKDSIKP